MGDGARAWPPSRAWQSALQLPEAVAPSYALDSNASLFLNLFGVPDEHLVAAPPRADGRPAGCEYAPTGTVPCVLHGAGKGGKAKMRRAMGCVAPDAWRPQPGEPWIEYRARGDLKG